MIREWEFLKTNLGRNMCTCTTAYNSCVHCFFSKKLYVFVLRIQPQFGKNQHTYKVTTKWEHWNWNEVDNLKDKNIITENKMLGGDYNWEKMQSFDAFFLTSPQKIGEISQKFVAVDVEDFLPFVQNRTSNSDVHRLNNSRWNGVLNKIVEPWGFTMCAKVWFDFP